MAFRSQKKAAERRESEVKKLMKLASAVKIEDPNASKRRDDLARGQSIHHSKKLQRESTFASKQIQTEQEEVDGSKKK